MKPRLLCKNRRMLPPAAFGRLCVETKNERAPIEVSITSRLRAAVC